MNDSARRVKEWREEKEHEEKREIGERRFRLRLGLREKLRK